MVWGGAVCGLPGLLAGVNGLLAACNATLSIVFLSPQRLHLQVSTLPAMPTSQWWGGQAGLLSWSGMRAEEQIPYTLRRLGPWHSACFRELGTSDYRGDKVSEQLGNTVRESLVGWGKGNCCICGSSPTRWRIDLPEPDHRGRLTAFFCKSHEANRDMLIAQLKCDEDDELAA